MAIARALRNKLRNNGKMLKNGRHLLLPILLLSAVVCLAQSTPDAPTCDNVNNTSASSHFQGSQQNAAPGNVSKLPIRSLLYRGSQTKIYTRYMPWFGDHRHRDVGYRSDDEQQVSRQVADMISRGIQGAIVDWYGPNSEVHNQSTLLLMKESEAQNFEFAISEDAGSLKECEKGRCDVTQKLISDLNYAAEHFLSSSNYVRFDGRPALFFFGVEKFPIDWRRVRHSVQGNPLIFFRNSGTFANPDADGAFAWIAPETANSGDPMGMEYINRFYTKAQGSNKIAMGSAYKGFNDADASWGKGRVIDQQCGKTWLATFAEAGRFYSSSHQLPALIIPTWNDYEEGTEIETGIDNCVQVQASVADQKLSWTISGEEEMIDHYSVLVQNGSAWTDAADVPRREHSIALSRLGLTAPSGALCVEAVGRASMLNHSSGAIQYSAAGK
jgi:hypothetical protein